MSATQNEISVSNQGPSLIRRIADRYSVDQSKLLNTLKSTAFSTKVRGESIEISDQQMMALLIVADQFGLNPFTKEIYAFPREGGIVPVVGIDGWIRIANDHPAFQGIEFVYADSEGNQPPEWIECAIYRNDRDRPTVIREYLDECRPANPSPAWKSHPRRMLRHKALIQCARTAFGFGGIHDPDEAAEIIQGDFVTIDNVSPNAADVPQSIRAAAEAKRAAALPNESGSEDNGESSTINDFIGRIQDADSVAELRLIHADFSAFGQSDQKIKAEFDSAFATALEFINARNAED